MSFKILGTGNHLPETVITNDNLSEIMDTTDEWITTRTGIKERRISVNEDMTYLCVESSRKALEEANVLPEELDLIICATIRGDYITPSQACLIQEGIGANCPAFDVNAACSGFLYAMDIANSYFISGRVKKVLVVAYEVMTKLVDWNDRNTCVLFGDGGGAVVLGEGNELLGIRITAKGGKDMLSIPNTNGDCPFGKKKINKQFLSMSGSEVFKFAVNKIIEEVNNVIMMSKIEKRDVDVVLIHQANMRIIEFARQRLGLENAIFVSNLSRYGNTSSGSIPVLLDEMRKNKTIKSGQVVAMVAFGGGMTAGSAIMRIE